MAGIQGQVLAAASVLMLVSSLVGANCPRRAMERVQQCVANVLPNLSPDKNGPNAYTNQVQVARETCRDDKLRVAADCIEEIMDRCKGMTEEEQILQRLINKEKMLDTVDYFCRHFRVYERNVKCIIRHHEEVATCSSEAQQNFLAKMNAGANMDVLIMGSCRFHAVARSCLTNSTTLHCGKTAGNFVYRLLTGLIPPYCDADEDNPEYRPLDPKTPNRRWNDDRDYYPDSASDGSSAARTVVTLSLIPTALLLLSTI